MLSEDKLEAIMCAMKLRYMVSKLLELGTEPTLESLASTRIALANMVVKKLSMTLVMSNFMQPHERGRRF